MKTKLQCDFYKTKKININKKTHELIISFLILNKIYYFLPFIKPRNPPNTEEEKKSKMLDN